MRKICLYLVLLIVVDWGIHASRRGVPSSLKLKKRGHSSKVEECMKFGNKKMRAACKSISTNPIFDLTFAFPPPPNKTEPQVLPRRQGDSSLLRHATVLRDSFEDYDDEYAPPSSPPKNPDGGELGSECVGLGGAGKHQMSLSPWEYYLDRDNFRYPKEILFAKCLCTGCIDASTLGENLNLASELLTTKAPVIMRKSKMTEFYSCTSSSCYVHVIEVPIGCHCTFPQFRSK